MAGERSWNKINAGVGKNLRVAQPAEIVAEEEAVHGQTFKTSFMDEMLDVVGNFKSSEKKNASVPLYAFAALY